MSYLHKITNLTVIEDCIIYTIVMVAQLTITRIEKPFEIYSWKYYE